MSIRALEFLDRHKQLQSLLVLSMLKPEKGCRFVADLSAIEPTVTPKRFKELQAAMFDLTHALTEILDGADAKKIFGQLGRPKPKEDARDFTCAVAYWAARAALGPDPKTSLPLAIEAARSAMRDRGYSKWDLPDQRIKGIAKKLRKSCLEYFDEWAYPLELQEPVAIAAPNPKLGQAYLSEWSPFAGMYLVTKKKLAALKKYLARKGPRPI